MLLLSPHSPDVVAVNRREWRPGDPVAEIYGLLSSRPVRVLFVPADRIFVPMEDHTLSLFPVEGNPLQEKTVGWGAKILVLLGILLSTLGGAGWLSDRLRRRTS